jgi:hypothetical protein
MLAYSVGGRLCVYVRLWGWGWVGGWGTFTRALHEMLAYSVGGRWVYVRLCGWGVGGCVCVYVVCVYVTGTFASRPSALISFTTHTHTHTHTHTFRTQVVFILLIFSFSLLFVYNLGGDATGVSGGWILSDVWC